MKITHFWCIFVCNTAARGRAGNIPRATGKLISFEYESISQVFFDSNRQKASD